MWSFVLIIYILITFSWHFPSVKMSMISIKGFKNLHGSESILSEITKFTRKAQTTNSRIPPAGGLHTGENTPGVGSLHRPPQTRQLQI